MQVTFDYLVYSFYIVYVWIQELLKGISILIVDGSDFVLLELGFQNTELKLIIDAWFEKFNISIHKYFIIILIRSIF